MQKCGMIEPLYWSWGVWRTLEKSSYSSRILHDQANLGLRYCSLDFSNFVQVEQSAVVHTIFIMVIRSGNLIVIYEKLIKDHLFVIIGFWTIPQNVKKLCNSFFVEIRRAQNCEIFFQIFSGHMVLWLLALKVFWNFKIFLVDFFLIFNISVFF